MKRVLIVAPHFPPVNAPDVHRVRMSLPYYEACGWVPIVLTVRAEDQDEPRDESLLETLPPIDVVRVRALPAGLTRPVGVGNVALRAFPALYRAGARLLRQGHIDLVYFSTTMFAAMPLGRIWKRQFGVPYVIDLQDPWFTTYYDDKPRAERPPKHTAAQAMHRRLEAWTLRDVDRIITVSAAYTEALQRRYPWITPGMCTTIPFGASARDADLADRIARASVRPAGPPWQAVYTGRGGSDMAHAARILFRALAGGNWPPESPPVRLSFIGTAYATGDRARKTIEPVAIEEGVASLVSESVGREPYLQVLARLRAADLLVLLGSDDPQYSGSKVYPYLHARRPILAIVHEASPLADVVRKSRSGLVITFSGRDDVAGPVDRTRAALTEIVGRLPFEPDIDPAMLDACSTGHLTAEQCRVFDAAVSPQRAVVSLPCAG